MVMVSRAEWPVLKLSCTLAADLSSYHLSQRLPVFLANLDGNRLLASMLAVASFRAALAIMYFMHMAQKRHSFFWSLIPATIFVLLMMNMIWSDSFRLLQMRPF